MCGGQGTRLCRDDVEKPLLEVAGEPMVERVLAALEASGVESVHAVTSPYSPETAARLEGRIPLVEGDGDGYVSDLATALEHVEPPVLTVVSDLPLLAAAHVDGALRIHVDRAAGGSVTVAVPTALKRALGVSADTSRHHGGHELSSTGLNVVGVADCEPVDADSGESDGADETIHVSYDARLAVNVNRPGDVEVAEVLADGP